MNFAKIIQYFRRIFASIIFKPNHRHSFIITRIPTHMYTSTEYGESFKLQRRENLLVQKFISTFEVRMIIIVVKRLFSFGSCFANEKCSDEFTSNLFGSNAKLFIITIWGFEEKFIVLVCEKDCEKCIRLEKNSGGTKNQVARIKCVALFGVSFRILF